MERGRDRERKESNLLETRIFFGVGWPGVTPGAGNREAVMDGGIKEAKMLRCMNKGFGRLRATGAREDSVPSVAALSGLMFFNLPVYVG